MRNLLNELDVEVEEQNRVEGFRGMSLKMDFNIKDEDLTNALMITYAIELI